MPLKTPLEKIQFEIHLTEHCNLNCAGCNNFSCIAEPEFVDVNEFERDFKRMGEIFNHDCHRIYLLGGEPLLHPEIIKLMKIARKNFSSGHIFIFTNGILLSSQSDEFWQACHDNNIRIVISAYPIKIDDEKIKSMSEKFGVRTEWAWGQNKNERDTFGMFRIDLDGKQNGRKNFLYCGSANGCITLSHGRLTTCVFAAHAHHFNKKFNKNIEITERDNIDIYDESNTKEIILKKLTQPIPACRYCYTASTEQKTFKWHVTKGDISEWGC